MTHHLRQYFANPVLRMVFWATVLSGAMAAPIGTYQSLIAIERLGVADGHFAAILLLGLVVGTIASLWIGVVTDQRPWRRKAGLAVAGGLALGNILMWLAPSAPMFLAVHGLLMPLMVTLFGQLFAVARLAAGNLPAADRDAAVANVRAFFAVPFIFVLPIWGWLVGSGASLLSVYGAGSVLALIMVAVIYRGWPDDTNAAWEDRKSGLTLRGSLAEIADPAVIIRVALIGLIHVGASASGIVLGLIFARADGQGAGDVALFFGAFVAIEFTVMMMIGSLRARWRRLHIITVGVILYAIYLVGLPLLAGSPLVWLLILPAGAGGAMIYALAVGYLQDLLGTRAGAGSSLIALQRAVAEGTGAAIFAFGTWVYGYAIVPWIAAAISILAMAAIIRLDRFRPN